MYLNQKTAIRWSIRRQVPSTSGGAEPGDTLTVDILDIKLGSQGYLLAKQGVRPSR